MKPKETRTTDDIGETCEKIALRAAYALVWILNAISLSVVALYFAHRAGLL